MDPQSQAFTPQTDVSRLTQSIRSIEEAQKDQGDRLLRIEKKLEEDARMKSVWGSSSPFPGILSGTPQQGPIQHPSGAEFANFDDDQSNTMMRSLHLDAEDEPRRFGATSRTNSVRFDESANQAQWAHGPRSSIDLFTRTSSGLSGLGGHPLLERSSSHKSNDRYSSTGHSIVSGRANSLGFDSGNPFGNPSPDVPGLAPGLFILGSVPAIIRCWLNTNFKSEALLYAAVCTGSYKSYLDARLIKLLGYSDRIRHDISKNRKIKLPVYFPEAIPHMASSRSNSPITHLPTLTVDFSVVEPNGDQVDSKAIQVFIGSDMLRAHNADILFSSNSLTMFDDDRNKLSIPLVRPENDEAFKSLYITSSPMPQASLPQTPIRLSSHQQPSTENMTSVNDLEGLDIKDTASQQVQPRSLPSPIARPRHSPTDDTISRRSKEESEPEQEDSESRDQNTVTDRESSRLERKEPQEVSPSISAPPRTGSSPAIWSNWRRDGNSNYSQSDWANASRNSGATYARPSREQGIKVLRPSRTISRSSNAPQSASPVTGQSRFFDDGKRRNGNAVENEAAESESLSRTVSLDLGKSGGKENVQGTTMGKGRGANPIGGASAFGWLNSGQRK